MNADVKRRLREDLAYLRPGQALDLRALLADHDRLESFVAEVRTAGAETDLGEYSRRVTGALATLDAEE